MELIKVTQLPIVQEALKNKGLEVKEKLAYIETLACTEENKTEIKKIRADYNKEQKEFDAQFKIAISELEEPVIRLKQAYKDHIQTHYKNANLILGNKILEIEQAQKDEKTENLQAYFDECKQSANNGLIDFVNFSHCVQSITLSTTEKAYKKTISETIDKIVNETNSIATMEDKDVILLDYTKHLDFAKAVSDNAERKERIAEQQRLLAEREERARIERERLEELKSQQPVQEIIQAPTIQETVAEVDNIIKEVLQTSAEKQGAILKERTSGKDPEEYISVNFNVTGKRKNIKLIGEFLKANDIEYKFI